MRILVLTGMYPNTIAPLNGVVVAAQATALTRMGIKKSILHLYPEKRRNLISSFFLLRKMARNVDIVHIHYGIKATVLSLLQSRPVVATYHGTDINGYKYSGSTSLHKVLLFDLAAMCTRFLSQYLSHVIVMTDEMKRKLPRRTQMKCSVLPMGIDTALFTPMIQKDARQYVHWGDDPVIVFSNNNNEQIKRQDLAEATVEHIRADYPSARLLVLRNIPYERIPVILNAADCLLITSDMEGSPNIVKESIACGLPIVSVEVGDLRTWAKKLPDDITIADRDPHVLAEAVIKTLKRNVRIADTSCINEYTNESVAKKIIEIYKKVLENQPT